LRDNRRKGKREADSITKFSANVGAVAPHPASKADLSIRSPGCSPERSPAVVAITTQDLLWSYVAAIALAILFVLSVVAVLAMKRTAAAREAEA
jgi:hypothetical protein